MDFQNDIYVSDRKDELKLNPQTNLLELMSFEYALQNVEQPNLYRMLFNYEEVPKMMFNQRLVPMHMPKDIWITDTTFRDGQQSREPYTTEQIVHLFEMLHRLGGPKGIIRQSEFFLYSRKDRAAVYQCLEKGYEFPEITSWIRASKEDFKLVREIGLKETGILVSCSDYHIFYKLKMNRRQAIDHYLGVVKDCIDAGIKPRCHFEDITRADFYGFVVPFVTELHKLMVETGVPIKIRACDTLGYGVGTPGVALPRSIPGIIYGLRHYAHMPSSLLEFHGHNDFYKAVSNSTTAWLYGASGVNCSLLGIGERTGNCPLEAMVMEYAQLKGTLDGMDPTVITEIAEYYEKEIGYKIPPRTPFVGADFNVTRAGVHADGLLKNEEVYNIFDTGKLLNRPPKVMISNTSGASGIAIWINTHLKLTGEAAIDKKDPLVTELKTWVDKQYAEGRVTAITDDELKAQLTIVAEKLAEGNGNEE
ncbi:MAG: 2-isopropylmalate synthase [Firmicutes bacterium]|nr:2-isopropylmalate synthase [Bacillota bacterium]